ncbi:MAG: methylmalonyl Co-A mutase-associated GTPase MeaB [Actinomycetota bacterium]|nr:methylmalonyl Co-A mutase-associated GTPase MeaB [Actinomycetota bacterium]
MGDQLREYVEGVREGSRRWVARAITLVESSRPDHRELAQRLLVELMPETGKARRVGITGVPGVGKSTFIDSLGTRLVSAGHRVGVLAVDPSSSRSGGSILGDKTRMARLAADEAAFIRPSPTAGTLGGVATATRESMVVLEAAGFDVLIVETVGVGQSEYAVADMVDTFLFLTLARTGDALQGIKRGILELADVIAVNKADGPGEHEARRAARELASALRMLPGPDPQWEVPVLTCSAAADIGIDTVWEKVVEHQDRLEAAGELTERRRRQQVRWMWAMVNDQLRARLRAHPEVRAMTADLERAVLKGELTPTLGADQILTTFLPDAFLLTCDPDPSQPH